MRRLLVGMVMTSIAVLTPIGALAGDQEIAQHILKKIDAEKKAGHLRGFDINLRVDAGKVFLTGHVASQQQLEKLLKIASHTTHLGTDRVFNRVTVTKPTQATAVPQEKQGQFPNLLAVFQNDEEQQPARQATAAEAVKPAASVVKRPEASKNPQPRISSRRTFQMANSPKPQAKRDVKLTKQATSNQIAGKASQLPIQPARPTPAMRVAKSVPAAHEAPTAPPLVRRQVQLASNEIDSAIPRSVAAPAIRLAMAPTPARAPTPTLARAPAPTPAPVRPTQLEPISRPNTGNASQPLSSAQLAQLQRLQLAQLRHLQWQQMQQAQLASNQMPVAFAPAANGMAAPPMAAPPMAAPPYMPVSNGPALHHDHPNMPPYAWPGYAAHPNYAAVTYPKQYSPSAWPYIGPFYPYPQVPLGWRKVQLEWDDGWWFLNFKNRHFR